MVRSVSIASCSTRSIAVLLLLAAGLAGCASAPTAPGGRPGSAPTVDTGAALNNERQWLASWFKGTPVAIGQRDGAVTVEVPREFCFDAAKSSVKAPLAAVLDKVAESMRRVPGTQLAFVAAPDDGNGGSPLAVQRAAQVREYLRGRGVAPVRLAKASASTAAAVQLRIEASSL